ncbi:S-layer homology domain-containing protein [Paenibacillus sp. JCM 10914]
MNARLSKRISFLLSISLILSMVLPLASTFAETASAPTQSDSHLPVLDFVALNDETLRLTDINAALDELDGKSDYLALFTSGGIVTNDGYLQDISVSEFHVAVSVDDNGTVQDVIGGITPDAQGAQSTDTTLPIPERGYVVMAGGDSSRDTSVYKQSLSLHFKAGEQAKLTGDGREWTAGDFVAVPQEPNPGGEPAPQPEPPDPGGEDPGQDPGPLTPQLQLLTQTDTVVEIPVVEVAGMVTTDIQALGVQEMDVKVTINDEETELTADGIFRMNVYLEPGPNGITVRLLQGGSELAIETLNIIYEPLDNQDYLEVEAAPKDVTIGIEGPRRQIDYVDRDVTGIPNIVAIFTRDYGSMITIPQTNVAVQVDANNRVLRVVNPSIDGKPPVWTGPTDLEIPEGGYVLMAQDSSYAGNNIKRYLAENFKAHDPIKLRKNGEVVQVRDIMSGNGLIARLKLDNQAMYTVTEGSTVITGLIENIDDISVISLLVNDAEIPFQEDGTFMHSYALSNGTNYIEVKVLKNDVEQDTRYLAVFARPDFSSDKEVILWVDQAANARKFQSSEQVQTFLQKAKDTGVTSVVFDVKGVEGYASYKKNTLTGRPYVSEIKAPEKAGASPDLDLLEEFLQHGHALGLKIHAAINVFAEGSIAHQEFAVLNDHLDWEERVYFPENGGEIKRLRESAKQGLVAFVNPSNDEVRAYQLDTFREIIENYNVDGVVHDRGRYDNEAADFSDETKEKFEQFLLDRGTGKQLVNWPEDIFYYDADKRRVDGPLIQEWWEFRSGTIQSFFSDVKTMVDEHEATSGRTIEVSSYVGSWYETYYLNGVNWGSKNFRYDPALGMPDESVYTPEYYNTGYIEFLDFLMIGAYQTTSQEIQKYITLGNIVTNGEIPLYAGIALNNVQAPAVQREVFQAGLKSTNGLMLFDASQINWAIAEAALQDREWVKDYQLGMSLPGNTESFLEGNYYNVNRIEGNINVMTEAFGYSTGTNRFGVEVVVDQTGQVTRVVNRNQAINWSWGAPEENNSVIPQGGFVITALDPSGTRTYRQLVANAYNSGDQVRSAVLSGLMDDEGLETRNSRLELEGNVEVLGPGQAAVKVNGADATLKADGTFTIHVPLATGVNEITVEVRVDEYKTNSRTFNVIRTSTGDGGTGPENPGTPGDGGSTGTIPPTTTPPKVQEPERLSVKKEQTASGAEIVTAQVHEQRMLEEVASLRNQPAASRVLTYTLEGADEVILNLPFQGLSSAIKDLPGGMVSVETSQGRLKLPLAVLSTAMNQRGTSERLQIRISSIVDMGSGKLMDGASVIGGPIHIELGWVQGDREEPIILTGGHAKFITAVKGVAKASTTTVLRSHPVSGQQDYVPAVMTPSDGNVDVSFIVRQGGTYVVVAFTKSFDDLNGHWASDDVSLLASKRVIEGVSATRFGPNKPITRAQFTAMLVRSLGLPDHSKEANFEDVQGTEWYAAAVATAVEHGLIEGFSDGDFRPNHPITREQMSVLLQRALRLAGMELESVDPHSMLDVYEDHDRIGTWSQEAVAAVVHAGLMEGRSASAFVPGAHSTRAESAVVLARMLQLAGFLNR